MNRGREKTGPRGVAHPGLDTDWQALHPPSVASQLSSEVAADEPERDAIP
jgi:hypothetical protein